MIFSFQLAFYWLTEFCEFALFLLSGVYSDCDACDVLFILTGVVLAVKTVMSCAVLYSCCVD